MLKALTNLLYQLAPVRKDSQGVLLYRLTRDDSDAQSPAFGPVTRKQLREVFEHLSAQNSEVRYSVWSEQRVISENASEIPVDSRVQSIEQACAGGNCHCFLARLKKIIRYNHREVSEEDEDELESFSEYVLSELQGLTGLDVMTVPQLSVSEDSLPTERLYPRSRKVDETIIETCDGKFHGGVQQLWFDHVCGSASITW